MPRDRDRVHNRLEVLRAERGLSRRDLANQLDINHQTVGYIERGDYNPSLELALRLSDLFGLPVEAIFSLAPMARLSDTMYGTTTEPRTRKNRSVRPGYASAPNRDTREPAAHFSVFARMTSKGAPKKQTNSAFKGSPGLGRISVPGTGGHGANRSERVTCFQRKTSR